MTMKLKLINKVCMSAVAAAFAFAAVTALAEPSLAVKEDTAQMTSDKAALQRQITRLDADEARLKADTASGRMSAESKDAYAVYMGKQAIVGGNKDIAADKASSLQMTSDRAALQRQIKRLDVAEARLKADTKEGKMAAESKDSTKVYRDQQSLKSEKKDIAADNTKLIADQKK